MASGDPNTLSLDRDSMVLQGAWRKKREISHTVIEWESGDAMITLHRTQSVPAFVIEYDDGQTIRTKKFFCADAAMEYIQKTADEHVLVAVHSS